MVNSFRLPVFWAAVAVAVLCFAGFAFGKPQARASSAIVCAGFSAVDSLPSLFTSVVPDNLSGSAPLAVAITLREGIVAIPSTDFFTSSWDWGDGSGSTPLRAEGCTDDADLAYWPAQTLRHTYAAPGNYRILWNLTFIGIGVPAISFPIFFVTVTDQAPPTATPVPATATPVPPTATSVPATATAAGPTATPPQATATPPPGTATAQVTAAATAAGSATALTSATAAVQPTGTSSAASPSPSVTASRTTSPGVGAVASPGSTPPSGGTDASKRERPSAPSSDEGSYASIGDYRTEFAASFPSLDDVSTDPGVVVTNIALAGITIWVLFSSVFLNQVLQDHRGEIDAKTARFTRPLRKFGSVLSQGAGAGGRRGRSVLAAAAVLVLTALIYGFLDPQFGLNRASGLLVVAVITGVGLVTYVTSGTEARATRRILGHVAAVRPFPATIFVAIASVAVSRATHLQPGVIYGFVASCAVAETVQADPRRRGHIALLATSAGLALTLLCWLAIGPLRSANVDGNDALLSLAETVCVTVFIGGVEGLFFNMIPISVMDGSKIFKWRRSIWAGFALVAAFLFWHVLFNRDKSNFDALRQASSVTVLVLFAFYSFASVGLWWGFRRSDIRKAKEA